MSSGHKRSLPVFQKNAAFCRLLSASSKTQVHKHSSKFEEFTDSTFLLPQSINWFVKSSALTSPFLTLLSRSPFMTHRACRCVSSQSKPKLFISQKYKIQIYFHIFSAPSVPGAPDFCRQFIANNQCWQGTTSMIKDYTTVQIWADEDRPSLPLKPFSVSSSFHFYTFLQSPPRTLCRRLPLYHLLCPYEICRRQSVNSRAAWRLELPEWQQGKVTSEWKM